MLFKVFSLVDFRWKMLRFTLVLVVNHKHVQRLIQEIGLQVCTKKRRKYSSYKGEQGKIAPNLLQRDFSASKPNEKWLTDITEFRVKDEKLYFSPILDCFNNELIAYGLSRRPNGMLVQEMLLQAVEKLPRNANLILHSDQGIHYQMPSYQRLLAKIGFLKVCPERGIVWIMRQWKVFLDE